MKVLKKLLISIDSEKCDFCGTCVGVCPADAIDLNEALIKVKEEKCTMCMVCIDVCPLGAMGSV